MRVLVVGPAPASRLSRGGMATVAALMDAHPDPRFRVTAIATYVDGGPWRRLSVGVSGMLRSAWLILRGRVDVLHVHLSHGGSVVRKAVPLLAARRAKVPAIIHGHSFDFGGWFDTLPAGLQRLVRAALPADRWVVLGTEHRCEYAVRMGLPADRIDVLPNAIRLPAQPVEHIAADPVHAVMLGRLGERKGTYDIVAAVRALPAPVRRRLRITLAGDGENVAVRDAVAAANLAGTVHVVGWLTESERDQLLSTADVFLLPSYDEGLPMALLEAMAWGLAPIASAAGSIGEVITDGVDGLVVEAGDARQIADALAALVTDETLRRRIGLAARERARGFALSGWYARLAELWASLAVTSATPRRTTAG
ncbi:glycosyltransferase family 4 protein [Mycobacterium sp. IDR2000157661]|nr:glycosyltransferase family 4 protein [Mycobacterium sp. IDR2000157661]